MVGQFDYASHQLTHQPIFSGKHIVSLMKTVLPLKPVETLLSRNRYPVLTAGLVLFVPLIVLFVGSGAIYPADVDPWAENPIEITGLFLMMAVLPTYLLMCFIATRRRSHQTHAFIARHLPDNADHDSLRNLWMNWWPLGIVFGVVMGLSNTNWVSLDFSLDSPMAAVSYCIAIGQFVMWHIVGLVLFFAVQEALALNRFGKLVNVNLYNLDSLNGFGRNALNNFLMIAGALALTTLQALDQEFRWINYRNGLIVGIPAALILVPLPIWNLHRRIVAAKQELVSEINRLIDVTPTALKGEAAEEMNSLLVRRTQIQNLRNWPMSLPMATRFVAYAFIVPMAWAGAALVEFMLDSVLVQ